MHKDDWNVATSQRRDSPMSRRPNVAKSQRRNVSAGYSSQSLKAKGDQISRGIGDQGTYELGHGNQDSSDIDLKEEPVICIFFHFGQ